MAASQPLASSLKREASLKPPVTPMERQILEKLKPAKVFHDAVEISSVKSLDGQTAMPSTRQQITSIAFDATGEKCLTADEVDAFILWDVNKAKKVRTFYSKKYGISHARFTHRSQNIIHASTKLDDHTIRYHSMHDNKYLSYFRGHTGRVRSLAMSPIDDTFLSAGEDGTVRLWDLRSPNGKGLLNDVGGSTIAAFDNTGSVFAVACSETQTIMLFGTNTLDNAPFHYAPLIDVVLAERSQPPPKPLFTSISFSNNGKYILIGTSSDVHYVLDAYTLSIVHRLSGHQGLGIGSVQPRHGSSGEEVSWSADSRWIASGSADGGIYLWDIVTAPEQGKMDPPIVPDHLKQSQPASTLQPTVSLSGSRAASRAVKLNPRLLVMAVGGEELSLWLPAKDEDNKVQEGW